MLRRWVETSPAAARLTSRFVAGRSIDQEIEVIQRLARDGFLATIDYLGENVTSLEEARRSRDAYLGILDRIAPLSAGATVSVKLTQLGLDMSGEACRANLTALVERAIQIGTAVEIDMESHEYVDRTLNIVTAIHERYGHVRAVIQAYLRRSERDVDRLCDLRIPARLCKGAYREPPEIAYQKKTEVDANYVRLMHKILGRGAYPAIATHDESILAEAVKAVKSKNLASDGFEFQMLYGIRRDLQKRLVTDGCRLRLYVPYGDAWYPYFMRRLAERPANLMFIVRNLVRR